MGGKDLCFPVSKMYLGNDILSYGGENSQCYTSCGIYKMEWSVLSLDFPLLYIQVYISSKRRTKKNLHPLLGGGGI